MSCKPYSETAWSKFLKFLPEMESYKKIQNMQKKFSCGRGLEFKLEQTKDFIIGGPYFAVAILELKK